MTAIVWIIGAWLGYHFIRGALAAWTAPRLTPIERARLRYEQIRAERVMEYLYHRDDYDN